MSVNHVDNATVIGPERQIVAMNLGDQVFGIDIAFINTVITPQPITRVPRTPGFVKGVMNLRGRIMPVLDIRERFGIDPESWSAPADTRVVIVEVEGLSVGLVVDNVSEVLRLPESAIEAPSTVLDSQEVDCITGIGRIKLHGRKEADEDCFILLLDIQKVLGAGNTEIDLSKLAKAA
jgi:purine-binding chemotaxis protein CheW